MQVECSKLAGTRPDRSDGSIPRIVIRVLLILETVSFLYCTNSRYKKKKENPNELTQTGSPTTTKTRTIRCQSSLYAIGWTISNMFRLFNDFQ